MKLIFFVAFILRFTCSGQNVNVSVPIHRATSHTVNKIIDDPQTGGYYASGWPSSMIRLNPSFDLLWERTWTGAFGTDGAGTHSLALHANGDLITCSDSFGAVNGLGSVSQSTWTQFAVLRIKPDSTISQNVMYGGTSYDWCYDMAMSSDTSGAFYYLVGFKCGNFITASSTGLRDAIIIKFNFADQSIVWSYSSTSLISVTDEGFGVKEIDAARVQMVTRSDGSTLRLLTFNTANGALLTNVVTEVPDWTTTMFYDDSTKWWWFLASNKIVYGVDTAGNTMFRWQLASSLAPSVFAIDSKSANIFVGCKDTNVFSIVQIGVLSGTTFTRTWTPAVSTDTLGTAKVSGRHLIVGGSQFIRMFPNVTFIDSCPQGRIRMNMSCIACGNGTSAVNETCQTCPAGFYCPGGVLTPCPANSSSLLSGSSTVVQCLCNTGFFGTNGTCTICPKGRYCVGGTTALMCGNFSSTLAAGSKSNSSCICHPGYFGAGGSCTICPKGKFCPGAFESTACGDFSDTASTGSVSMSDCVCNSGHFGVNGVCNICPKGKFCGGGASWTDCGPNSSTGITGARSAGECLCNPGFYDLNGICSFCPKGFFCSGGNDSMISCGPSSDTTSTGSASITDCICQPGYYKNQGVCSVCLQNYYCPGGSMAISCGTFGATLSSGMTSLANCSCVAGTYKLNGNCIECPIGSFCPGGFSMHACPAGTTTNSIMSISQSQCACMPGYYVAGDSCFICPIGSYCPNGLKPNRCIANGTTSTEGAKDVSECVCAFGWVKIDGACKECVKSNGCDPDGNTNSVSSFFEIILSNPLYSGLFFGIGGLTVACIISTVTVLIYRRRLQPHNQKHFDLTNVSDLSSIATSTSGMISTDMTSASRNRLRTNYSAQSRNTPRTNHHARTVNLSRTRRK